MINTALYWLDQGIAVIPIGYRSKRPNTQFLHNGEWKQYQKQLPCRGVVGEWFASPFTNIAVICGWQNLVIVDFDNMAAHDLWLTTYGIDGYADTYHVSTGRGYHYYFFVEDYPPYTMKWAGGEIKTSGYCLIPPSVHPTGREYQAVNDDLEIMTIGSIDEIFPPGLFVQPEPAHTPTRLVTSDIFDHAILGQSSCDEINQRIRITQFFSNMRRTGSGWYTVQCPLHEDGRKWSGWINDNANRYGCHCCVTGSLSVIDFYMRLHNISLVNIFTTKKRKLSKANC